MDRLRTRSHYPLVYRVSTRPPRSTDGVTSIHDTQSARSDDASFRSQRLDSSASDLRPERAGRAVFLGMQTPFSLCSAVHVCRALAAALLLEACGGQPASSKDDVPDDASTQADGAADDDAPDSAPKKGKGKGKGKGKPSTTATVIAAGAAIAPGAAGCTGDTYASYGATFFAGRCDGCHGAAYSSYAAVSASAKQIQAEISNGSMPKGPPLPASERDRILLWFKCGLPQ